MTLTIESLQRRFPEGGVPVDRSPTYATARMYCLNAATAILQTTSPGDDQAERAVDGLQEVLYRWERAVLLTTGGQRGAYPDEIAQVTELFGLGELLDVPSAWPYTMARKWCTQIAVTIVEKARYSSDRVAALDVLVSVLYRWERAIGQTVQPVAGGGLAGPFPPPPVEVVAASGQGGGGPSSYGVAAGAEACRSGQREIERLLAALMSAQEFLWSDLDRAYHGSLATPPQASNGCESLIHRIQENAAIVGPVDPGHASYPLLAAGVYVDVYAAIGITVFVPDDLMAKAWAWVEAHPRPVNS